jgi:ribonuclease T1
MRNSLLLLLVLGFAWIAGPTAARESAAVIASISIAELPREVQQTLSLIKRGGLFPYRRDGVVFGNREQRLPHKTRGYYHEYTVATPGRHDRGARRIVTGEASEYYYSDDHYRSFRKIRE